MSKRGLIFAITLLAGIFCGTLAGAFFILIHDLPQINSLKQYKPSAVTTIYSADRKVVARLYTQKRYPVGIEDIPDNLINALINTEDRLFFSHSGINAKAIVRAIITDIRARRFKQGASTLTQQLAKTLFLTSEKSFVRKIKELILALQIERRYTKKEILELYLNQIYLGSGAYGVEAACRTYFNRSVSDIDLAQAAMIAGLPKAPSVYSPLANPERARQRRRLVLRQMLANDIITSEMFSAADAQAPASPGSGEPQKQTAYFVDYVKRFLKKEFGMQQFYSKGMSIHTTLDPDFQKASRQAAAEQMTRLAERREKRGLTSEKTQCALIALDNKTGGILAMVGGKDYNQSRFNRAVDAFRQPGSAFKPFVYAAAIQAGADQNQIIQDAPLSYLLENQRTWQVNNFSKSYLGPTTLRKALALSKNTPAVRLMEKTGITNVIQLASKAGISTLLEPNLSLALGSSEVSLMELTSAYIPFANMGTRVSPFPVLSITDAEGRVVYRSAVQKQAIMPRADAAIMADMLKAVVLEGTAKKARGIPREIGGKTGTTDDFRDALFIGFSPDLTIGVWVGNDDATPLGKNETGAKAALPIWIEAMKHQTKGTPWQYFDIPDGTKMIYMDPSTGRLSAGGKTANSIKALIRTEETR